MTVVKYVGHTGSEFIIDGAHGIGMERGEILDWEYTVLELGGYIDNFYRESRAFDGRFFIGADGSHSASERLDTFMTLTARDRGARSPGRLYVGDWFVPVYHIGLSHEYTDQDEVFKCVGRFKTDAPQWSREREVQFRPRESHTGFDYPHDFPHDYSPSWFTGAVLNTSPLPCAVRIRVQGPATDWHVRIADNVYSCNKNLVEGETLFIDGKEEKIWFTDTLGNVSNAFDTWKGAGVFKEHSGSFIFEYAPSGESPISWDGCDAVAITLCEVRDEWLWGSVL